MAEASSDNPFVPQQEQYTTTHVINVQELHNKGKTKYITTNWHDRLSNLIIIGLGISILLGALSFFMSSLSFLMYLTPLPPIISFAIWGVKRLFYGKDLETLK